jgi:hypothetical protein
MPVGKLCSGVFVLPSYNFDGDFHHCKNHTAFVQMLVNAECALTFELVLTMTTFGFRKSVSDATRSFIMESQFHGLLWYKYKGIPLHFIFGHLLAGLFWTQNLFF